MSGAKRRASLWGASGAPVLWTPDALGANLFAWYDADSPSTLTLSGATWEWRDKSANARHLGVSSGRPNLPFLSTDSGTGRQCMNVRGSGWERAFVNFGLFQFIAVASISSSASTYPTFVRSGFDSCLFRLEPGDTFSLITWDSGGGFQGFLNGPLAAINDNLRTVGFGVTGSRSIRIDGSVVATDGSGASLKGSGTYFRIGEGEPGEFLEGRLCEMIFYGPGIDRQIPEGYLHHRWGIQSLLPGGHPYKVAPPTL